MVVNYFSLSCSSSNSQITASTNEIIRALLTLNPHKRLTARDALVAMETEAASRSLARSLAFHVVPDLDNPTTLEVRRCLAKVNFFATPSKYYFHILLCLACYSPSIFHAMSSLSCLALFNSICCWIFQS